MVFFDATLCLLLSQLSHFDDSPHSTPAPLFSLAQSTAVNDSMDTPYRELFLGYVECTTLGYCFLFFGHPPLTKTLKQGYS